MEKMTFIDPFTYEGTEVEYQPTHVELANGIYLFLKNKEHLKLVTPVICNKEATKLVLGVQSDDNMKYRITVEPLPMTVENS